MVCDTRIRALPATLRPAAEQRLQEALARLERALAGGTVKPVIGSNGAVAFKGLWLRDGISDVCAYRALTAQGSAAMRAAIARAEVNAGTKVNLQAVASGVHSHDGGTTWHTGH